MWGNQKRLYDDRDAYERKIEDLKALKARDEQRLEELQRIYDAEVKEKAEEEQRIKQVFAERSHNIEMESRKEKLARVVQYNFEQWFEVVGQFLKVKKPKKVEA